MYNPTRKIELRVPIGQWEMYCPHIPKDQSSLKRASTAKATWQGKEAIREVFYASNGDPTKQQIEMIYQQGSERSKNYNRKEIVYCRWIKLKPEILTFLNGYYRYPSMAGLPLECIHRYPNNKTDQRLTTQKIEPAMIDLAGFKPIPNLTNEKNAGKIMEDDLRMPSARGVIEDLFGGKN